MRSAALLGASLLVACVENPYLLGSLANPPPSLQPDDDLVVGMEETGVARLPDGLEIGGGTVDWVLEYRGQDATLDRWVAVAGPDLVSSGASAVGLETPFTDDTLAARAGTAAFSTDALEFSQAHYLVDVVFRSRASSPIVVGADWRLSRTDLELRFEVGSVTAIAPLAATDAWHHCTGWASQGRVGLVCNGQPASVSATAPGAFGDRVEVVGDADVAYLAAAVSAAGWGEDDLVTASRQRFFSLTGVLPTNPVLLPAPEFRASPAYLDLERNGVRRLFPVGEHWPRVVCRARGCGLLSESANLAGIFESEPSQWLASGGTVDADAAPFIDGTSRFDALVPSAAAEPYTLTLTHGLGPGRYAISFFARAGGSDRIAFEIDGTGPVEYDLTTSAVIRSPAEALGAWAEDWGDGVVRCVYVREYMGSEKTFSLYALDASGQTEIANPAGTPSHYVTGVQINVGRAAPMSLLVDGDAPQPGEQLSYPAPSELTDATTLQAEVLLPDVTPLLNVIVIALHETETERLSVFSSGQSGAVLFGDLVNDRVIWDGEWHRVGARFGPQIELSVDDFVVSRDEVWIPRASLAIDVAGSRGTTQLEGMIRRLEIKSELP